MKAVLDTNVLIDVANDEPGARHRLERLGAGSGLYSVVTFCELLAGTEPENEERLDIFLGALNLCDATRTVAREAGRLRREHGRHGLDLPDAMIAATALVHGAALITRDRIFSRIPGLRVEGW